MGTLNLSRAVGKLPKQEGRSKKCRIKEKGIRHDKTPCMAVYPLDKPLSMLLVLGETSHQCPKNSEIEVSGPTPALALSVSPAFPGDTLCMSQDAGKICFEFSSIFDACGCKQNSHKVQPAKIL